VIFYSLKEQAMNVKLENGKISFDLLDLLTDLEGEEKDAIVEHFAWHDAIWEEIKRLVRDEFAAKNYNSKIHELRLEFLRSDGVKENIARVVESLLEEITHLENQRRDLQKNIWRWESWFRGFDANRYQPFPIQYERTGLEFLSTTAAMKFLDSVGVLADIEKPEKTEVVESSTARGDTP
jgi:hypothetical protein